jgi:hypothetical protein
MTDARQPPQPAHQVGPLPVAVVPREEFVSPVARQRHRDVLACELGHEIGGDLRTVGLGFVVHIGQLRHDPEEGRLVDIEIGMPGAEMGGDRAGVLGLVVAFLVKADREGMHRPV